MKNIGALCLAPAAALLLLGDSACAQVYSWKDPNSGQSKFSNIAPPWYSRAESVSGPRVIQTLGGRVVDDTALPYEDRLLLSGKSKDSIEKLRAQEYQVPRTRENQIPPSPKAGAEAASGRPADATAIRAETARNKGS